MSNDNKTMGIVGGAGPIASSLLLRYVVEICQRRYGCKKDADFPKIILLSIPFAQMLKPGTQEQDESMVSKQLKEALDLLVKNRASCIGIACNTLHGFLQNVDAYPSLINLVALTDQYLKQHDLSQVLVLGTQTAAMKAVHAFDGVCWLNATLQKEVDCIIDTILEGTISVAVKQKVEDVVQQSLKDHPNIDGVILGCTELSVLMAGESISLIGVPYIDPLVLLAEKLCERSFV